MRLAITGSSGYLGRLMVSALEEESHVSQILGLDVVGAPHGSRVKKIRSSQYGHTRPTGSSGP